MHCILTDVIARWIFANIQYSRAFLLNFSRATFCGMTTGRWAGESRGWVNCLPEFAGSSIYDRTVFNRSLDKRVCKELRFASTNSSFSSGSSRHLEVLGGDVYAWSSSVDAGPKTVGKAHYSTERVLDNALSISVSSPYRLVFKRILQLASAEHRQITILCFGMRSFSGKKRFGFVPSLGDTIGDHRVHCSFDRPQDTPFEDGK